MRIRGQRILLMFNLWKGKHSAMCKNEFSIRILNSFHFFFKLANKQPIPYNLFRLIFFLCRLITQLDEISWMYKENFMQFYCLFKFIWNKLEHYHIVLGVKKQTHTGFLFILISAKKSSDDSVYDHGSFSWKQNETEKNVLFLILNYSFILMSIGVTFMWMQLQFQCTHFYTWIKCWPPDSFHDVSQTANFNSSAERSPLELLSNFQIGSYVDSVYHTPIALYLVFLIATLSFKGKISQKLIWTSI